MATRHDVLFPAGRMISGNLYKLNHTDFDGKPRVFKSGAKAGQPNPVIQFGLAIAKQPGHTHFSQTEWGQKIWVAGHEGFPQANTRSDFAWKIEDGDSQVPNKRGKKPCDREGFPGHWVVWFQSSFPPKVYHLPAGQKDPVVFDQVDAVNAGDYIEVYGNVGYNDSPGNPGVFINGNMVCLVGYGQRIVSGPDAASVGFGQSPRPVGAQAAPVGGAMQHVAPPAPGAPAAPPPVPSAPAAPQAPAAPPAPVVAVAPNANFAPPPPVVAPPAATLTMLPGMGSYEQFRAAGWSDDQLVQHGKATRG